MRTVGDSITGQAGILLELVSGSIAPAIQEVGLSEAAFELLSAIDAAGDDATQSRVAQRMGISAPTLSESVKAIVQKGLISQEPSATDGRIRILRLTPMGRKALRAVLQQVRETETLMIADIADNDIEQCIRVLRQINNALARRLSETRTNSGL